MPAGVPLAFLGPLPPLALGTHPPSGAHPSGSPPPSLSLSLAPKIALTPLPGQSRPPSAFPTRPPPPSSFVWVMSLVAGGLIKLPTDPCQPKADRAAKSSFLYNTLSLSVRD